MEASRSVDTLGIIARSVDDVALYRDVLVDVPPEPVARASSAPRIAFCRTQYWPQLEPYAQADRCGWASSCAITMCRSPRRLPARRP